MRKISIAIVLVLFFFVVQWPSASERPHFDSRPRDGAITIDGRFDDWAGNLEPVGSTPMSMQIVNDGAFLYLRLSASDAGTRMEITRLGMTVWFDPSGGTKKKLGIRYPVVEAGIFGGGGERGHRGRAEGEPAEDPGPPHDRVDILGPGKDDGRSLMRDHLQGLDVAFRTEQGSLAYELKVPLARSSDHPYAIETQPGKTIGIGFETGKLSEHVGDGRGGSGRGGGGMGGGHGGGMGGRHGPGGGGGGEGRGFQPPKPIKVWATVTVGPAR